MKVQVTEALKSNDKSKIQAVYQSVLGKTFNEKCGDCLRDAKAELRHWLKEQEYQGAAINLFINPYLSENKERQKELEICLEQNEANPLITRIIEVNSRNYNAFFEAMKAFPDDVNIISNSDIFFDETLEEVKSISNFKCYALTRWEIENGIANFLNRRDSQDVWIFRGSPKVNADFNIGVPGCDNHLAWLIKKAGYMISNPSLTIRAFHLHQVKVFTYKNLPLIPEPYLFLNPTT